MTRPRLVWDVGAQLGEGPIWFPGERALRFVDIKSGRLHRYTPHTSETATIELGGQPSFVVATADGGLLVGADAGLYRVTQDGLGARAAAIAMPAHNRTNDGTVDGLGRLWFGTMDDQEQLPTGRVYCFEGGVLHAMGCDAVVTNGPAVSGDGRLLYHVDSAARAIWRFAIADGPRLERGEVFVRISEADGFPDGVVLDSEDCLWVALWDGWCVRRYAPDGRLLTQIDLPCARVTKLAFGDSDLRTAYVTSARVGLDAAALAQQPHAGGLFSFRVETPGRPTPAARC